MNILKKFYDKKKKEWYDRRYREGFSFVCCGYFIDKNDLIYYYQMARLGIEFDGENPFDRGILDAYHKLKFTHK